VQRFTAEWLDEMASRSSAWHLAGNDVSVNYSLSSPIAPVDFFMVHHDGVIFSSGLGRLSQADVEIRAARDAVESLLDGTLSIEDAFFSSHANVTGSADAILRLFGILHDVVG
jgi:alkyl sulfatase BDS1-like metallo-beta-lactamase superfamily hydrolase